MPETFSKWHPVTFDDGLIKAPIGQVCSELVFWHKSIGIEYSKQSVSTSFSDALGWLLPLAASKTRTLLVPTRSDWVAFFQNGIQGSDPSPAMTILSQRLKTSSMRICCTLTEAKYPATIWEVYDAGESRRTLFAANDGGKWTFGESGERYSFEQIDSYEKTKKKERFTKEMFSIYLRNFGIEAFVDEFYRVDAAAPAVCLQRSTKVWTSPEFSLEEAAAGLPWRRTQ